LTLVIDASALLSACSAEDGFRAFGDEKLVGPPLLWPEVRSSLHESLWRREISRELAQAALARLESSPVQPREPRGLGRTAWQLAEELGWAKTYDAEYLALAKILGVRLATQDARLLRRTAQLGFVVAVADLSPR
jgi:predicted nucleic acid-binding protein